MTKFRLFSITCAVSLGGLLFGFDSGVISGCEEAIQPVGGGARLTYRQYLLDRCFGAIWQMPEAVCEKFAAALQRPVFDLFLGRKCCVPSEMIFQGMAESEHEATEILASLGKKHQLVLQYAFRETAEAGEDTETILLADVPFRFGLHKVYGERWVKKELLSE